MYLIHFSHSYLEHRLPELDSLLVLNGLKRDDVYNINDYNPEYPFLKIKLPNDEVAKRIADRAVLIKGIYELWGEGIDLASCAESIKKLDSQFVEPYFNENSSWSLLVDGFGCTISYEKQDEYRQQFTDVLQFKGPVSIKNPDNSFRILLYYGLADEVKDIQYVYFCRFISHGQRDIKNKFDLKKRKYIGPTSTCAELAFLMANQGLCHPRGNNESVSSSHGNPIYLGSESYVWDPFCGTGSILIACTSLGAKTMGSDIDARVLRGIKRGKQENNVYINFDQYHLRYPDIVRMDIARLPLRIEEVYDAIVCDPPYGIRAGARKSGTTDEIKPSTHVPQQGDTIHFPKTQYYNPDDVIVDLLTLASRSLRLGGRLVYLFPTAGPYPEESVPCHPCLSLVANSNEALSGLLNRRLITMEKTQPYCVEKDAEYRAVAYKSLVDYNISYATLKQTIMQTNAEEGKDKSHRKLRKLENGKQYTCKDESSSIDHVLKTN